ncbi:hypothetical protein C8Q76DRAFT_91719 [Earliella scabrosa]|nr:hypothetical protein C8Q76DRAFT_91719 [Earliella scabrosa]
MYHRVLVHPSRLESTASNDMTTEQGVRCAHASLSRPYAAEASRVPNSRLRSEHPSPESYRGALHRRKRGRWFAY